MIFLDRNALDREISAGEEALIVVFWADWSGPCHIMTPVLEQLGNDYKGVVKIYTIDVDQSPEAMADYGVRSIPTLVFFRHGAVVDQISGIISKKELAEKLTAVLEMK